MGMRWGRDVVWSGGDQFILALVGSNSKWMCVGAHKSPLTIGSQSGCFPEDVPNEPCTSLMNPVPA